MRRPPAPRRDADFGAMTSMIDVVFLLLIFFVVTASSAPRELLLPTELSASGSVESTLPPPKPAALTVEVWLKLRWGPSGKTVVDMNGTDYENLADVRAQLQTLAELGPENPVVLDVGPDVPLGDVVNLYDTCQGAGFQSVSFAAGSANSKE